MKLEGALPVPSTTATIISPASDAAAAALGRVIVHGYTPEQPRDDRPTRVNGPIHCQRCEQAGLNGRGHNSSNRQCPARSVK